MANPEHVAILGQGQAAWNDWRKANGKSRGDLSGADFQGQDLSDIDLSWCDLHEANLAGTSLINARLVHSDLRGADLSDADMTRAIVTGAVCRNANFNKAQCWGARLLGASLSSAHLVRTNFVAASLDYANLSGSNLTGALFVEASLREANLADCPLVGADLAQARLSRTILTGCDLSGARNLETCLHKGPSAVDHVTLALSGSLPLAFLRGCGLPDNLIDYLPSMLNQAIQFYSCFISYASQDEDFVTRLHADLQNEGIRCWFAPEHMRPGDPLHQTIDSQIRLKDKLLLVLSETFVASAWVATEVRTALEEESKQDKPVLVPIRLDDAVMDTTDQWAHEIRRTRHVGDFTGWKDHDSYRQSFRRLLEALAVEPRGEGGRAG
ncbi:MAG: toll/interleukin-1 receptor domain-containing protein [Kiloniellales bacterium]|nr:toll/interleukin-1 receptor domain-containing protein [Kiloniellales bacterium]